MFSSYLYCDRSTNLTTNSRKSLPCLPLDPAPILTNPHRPHHFHQDPAHPSLPRRLCPPMNPLHPQMQVRVRVTHSPRRIVVASKTLAWIATVMMAKSLMVVNLKKKI